MSSNIYITMQLFTVCFLFDVCVADFYVLLHVCARTSVVYVVCNHNVAVMSARTSVVYVVCNHNVAVMSARTSVVYAVYTFITYMLYCVFVLCVCVLLSYHLHLFG
jgi:hypothetical protein